MGKKTTVRRSTTLSRHACQSIYMYNFQTTNAAKRDVKQNMYTRSSNILPLLEQTFIFIKLTCPFCACAYENGSG